MDQQRRWMAAAGAVVAVLGIVFIVLGSGEPSGPVYDAADRFESFLEEEAQDTSYLALEAAEGGFIDVKKVGDDLYRVTAGSRNFTDVALCKDGAPGTQELRRAFEAFNDVWVGTFAQQLYERLGPLNTVYRSTGRPAIATYAFRFTDEDVSVSFEVSGEQMAEWAFEEDYLDKGLFEDAFFQGARIRCR